VIVFAKAGIVGSTKKVVIGGQAICDGANVVALIAKRNLSWELLESKAIDGLQEVWRSDWLLC
jgi:hypothetical protein